MRCRVCVCLRNLVPRFVLRGEYPKGARGVPGLVVGMLAAENPSVDGHLAASTPRRRGTANTATRKLIDMSNNVTKCLKL